MKDLIRIFVPLIAIIIFVDFYYETPEGVYSIGGYPVWMKDVSGKQTNQTSGLSFVGGDSTNKTFISCDDIGDINLIRANEKNNPPTLEIIEIKFSDEIQILFNKFKKVDMEDIYFDKHNNKIYLSIEGHEYSSYDPEVYKKKEGIYEITFNNDIMKFDSILTIKRLSLPEEVYKYTLDNIGFEGFALTENYLYLGLENLQDTSNNFTDSTYIYIVDRKTNELKKSVTTKEHSISSISGLYAVDDHTLLGVDRNTRRMFYLKFDKDFNIEDSRLEVINLSIPGHEDIDKILGIATESLTLDGEGNIYVATDPWMDFYKPDLADRKKLSKDELDNFYNFVPVMYKFKNIFQK